jgi:hypothetical protein
MTNTNIITVPFHGNQLFVIDNNGQPITPMRPIVEGMGLSWQPQHRKLSENSARFSVTEMVMQLPGDDQKRSVICLPLRKLPGWLMSIHPNKVRPELRQNIIAYQNECDDALWAYWNDGLAINPRAYTVGPTDTLTAEQAETLRSMIRLAADKLPKEKQGEFIRRGWSKLKSHFKVGYREIPQAEFTEAVSIVARHCAQHGELLEAEQKPAITEQHILDAARAELTRPGRRFLVAFNTDGGEDLIKMMSVPTDAMLASWRSIPEMIRSPGNRPSTAEVTEIISACANLLSSRNALIQ